MSRSTAAGAALLCILIALLSRALYRLYVHPLAKFPGPRLAALTYGYEFYFDGVKGGEYTNEIGRMHKRYGHIIRINPDELHINDPEYIDQIYTGTSRRRDKWYHYTSQFGIDTSSFGTVPHERHRMIRGAMSRFFSRAAVSKLEGVIKEYADKLCDQLETHAGSGKPVNLAPAFSCLTTDIISEYAYASCTNFLDSPTFEPNFRDAIFVALSSGPVIKQWPPLLKIMEKLPETVVAAVMPEMPIYLRWQASLRKQIADLKAGKGAGYQKRSESEASIFHELLGSNLPEVEKTDRRLGEEGQAVLGAGSETTAWTMAVLTINILSNQDIFVKLRAEIEAAVSQLEDFPTWSRLEQLPYLTATITEGLRLSYGLGTRSARIAKEPLTFRTHDSEWIIPPDTPVGMTSVLIHHNEEIFSDPLRFRPERWLGKDGQRRYDLDKYFFSFSKGSRQCVGMNLAYAELYICLTTLMLRTIPRMTLFETTVKDVDWDHECFVPVAYRGSKGPRVLVEAV